MSTIYDNWERLVAAVLRREQLWQLCHQPSISSSLTSSFSSNFSFNYQFPRNSSFNFANQKRELPKHGHSLPFHVLARIKEIETFGGSYVVSLGYDLTVVVRRLMVGAMIACKVAAMVPERILSLALLNVTGGGYECIPKFDRKTLSIAMRFLRAKTPEQRAAVDLDTHYSQEYLEEYVGEKTRRSILYQEYVKGISATGMQSNYGFDGQINACWTHKMSRTELESIRLAGFPISVIHGSCAMLKRLAEKLYPSARMVELNGGHLVSHERTEEVNKALLELIKASESMIKLNDWTNLSNKSSGSKATRISLGRAIRSSFIVENVEKLQIFLVYFFGLFALAFEYLRRGVRRLKPVRVGSALT
ncbi:hypothetical protein DH2020_031032 [Rehmannia glutinosa]|uniref:Alpha/beta-Hydrolases superfamily protein n=1 Tax=Rehmannia glutinosa TaxID=99300 RepID=A0ABR0VM89_REHGL